MKKRFTLKEICCVAEIDIPEEYKACADEEVTMITCFGSRVSKGGALFPRGLTENGKPASRAADERHARKGYENGAKFIFSKEQYFGEKGEKLPCIIVKDPRELFMKLCRMVRSEFRKEMVTIAITGSVGKTSTTDMVALVVGDTKKTYFSKKNTNGFASIANHMQNIKDDIDVYIQEVGAYFPGLIDEGATMLEPNACIVTNIGTSHIDLYETVENIAYDKLGVARHMAPGGMAFLNYDDPMLRKADLDCNITWFSMDNPEADYYAKDVTYGDGCIEYDIVGGGETTHIKLHSYGLHNVINSVVAFAFGRWIGLSADEIAKTLLKFKTEGMRQNLCNIGGYRLFIDCFNAAPNTLEGAVNTITKIPVAAGKRRIAVLADMLKMGDLSEQLHTECGRTLAGYDIDLFLCYGPYMKYMAEELKKAGKKVIYTDKRETLNKLVEKEIDKGDLVLFKGGHKMSLSKTIDTVYGTSFYITDPDILISIGKDIKTEDFTAKRVDGMVEIRKCQSSAEKVVVPSYIENTPVVRIGGDAFSRVKTLQELEIGEGVTNIGTAAFYICSNLKKVTLPNTLKMIERSAFNYCTSLEEIVLPESVTTISHRAFYECRSLKKIVIGDSVKSIEGDEVFAKCSELTIYCMEDSCAEDYAKEHGIAYVSTPRPVEVKEEKKSLWKKIFSR